MNEWALRDSFHEIKGWLLAHDCVVRFRGRFEDEGDLGGTFSPPQGPNDRFTRIAIFRARSAESEGWASELATLVHEAGHWQSWKTGKRPPADRYDDAVKDKSTWLQLPEGTKRIIYDEEVMAWKLGREVLGCAVEEVPDGFCTYYGQRRQEGLTIYRTRLGIGG